jgi:hypothetical protein
MISSESGPGAMLSRRPEMMNKVRFCVPSIGIYLKKLINTAILAPSHKTFLQLIEINKFGSLGASVFSYLHKTRELETFTTLFA